MKELANSKLQFSSRNFLRQVFLLSSIFVLFSFSSGAVSNATDYFRSRITGSWNTAGNWESSSNNSSWATATLVPTSSAAIITILTGHTITINTNCTAPSVVIAGTGKLTFDGSAIRTMTISGDLTINASGGSFITQAAGTFTNTLSIAGNISNAGTFDMSRGGSTLVCTVTFNRNGNQTISGSGTTTRFSYVGLNMGTSNSNILEISSSNFQACANFLHSSAGSANQLQNGTIKFSGTYTFTNTLFQQGTYYNIVATAGIWLNNPNVTTTAIDDSYDLKGLLRITLGSFNVGTQSGNSIKYFTGSIFTVEGGSVTVSGRIQGTNTSNTTTYTQSGGVVTILTSISFTGSTGGMDFTAAGSSFIMSGGSIVLRNETASANDIVMYCSSIITGGTIQIGDASTSAISTVGYWIESQTTLPSITIYSILSGGVYPYVFLVNDLTVNGNITIGASCRFNVSQDGTNLYDISLTGNWINNGIFTARTKTVTFNGSAAQSLSGSTTTSFYNLTMNNTSSTGLTFSTPAIVTAGLTLTDGNIYTSNPNYLTMNAGSTSTSGSAASFVDGPMKKIGATDFIFPLGDGTRWRRMKISSIASSETFIAQYFNAAYANTTTYKTETTPLMWVSDLEYWTLSRVGTIDAVIELYWESATASSLPGCSNLRIAHWDSANNYWEKANIDAVTTTGLCSTTNTGTIYSNADITEFSPFTFGSTGISLPISFVSFDAKLIDRKVELTWETASEINNDYFTIEKTIDGINYEWVAKLNGAGNYSGNLVYNTVDEFPYQGISYYRLKQTDFDGNTETFPLRTISTLNTLKKSGIYPNPIKGFEPITINVNGNKNELLKIMITDGIGKTIYSTSITLLNTRESFTLQLQESLSSGIYKVSTIVGDQISSEKLIVY